MAAAKKAPSDPWRELSLAARPAAPGRPSRLVPVVGSGVLVQAFHDGPAAGEKTPLDWPGLLLSVAEDAGLTRPRQLLGRRDVPGQGTLLWEAMVLERAGIAPTEGATFRHELALRRLVARRLVRDPDARAARARCQPFLDRFLGLGFEDVITTNFDDWLAPGARAAAGPRPSLHVVRGATRIWHPHGHASRPQDIVLGARAYGVLIGELAAAFDEAVATSRRHGGRAARRAPRTVIEVALERPLLLAGLSLSREEWTIWWLLVQRARYLARKRERPPVFVVARRPAADDPVEAHAQFATLHRYATLLGLRLLEGSSWSDIWRRLGVALGMPVPRRAAVKRGRAPRGTAPRSAR